MQVIICVCAPLLTLEKRGSKVDTYVAVPRAAALRDLVRDGGDVELLEVLQDALAVAEADDDARHAEEERLDPEFAQLALEVGLIAVVADFGRCFELDPVDGCAGRAFGLGVPY